MFYGKLNFRFVVFRALRFGEFCCSGYGQAHLAVDYEIVNYAEDKARLAAADTGTAIPMRNIFVSGR